MKKLVLFVFIMIAGTLTFAQEKISYPADNSVYSIVVPGGWKSAIYNDYNVMEIFNTDETIIYSIYELDTILLFEAIKRAHAEADTEFETHEFSEITEEELNGIVFHKMSGSGLTIDDDHLEIEVIFFNINYNNFFMIYYSGLPEDINYYRIELDAMINSIRQK